MSLAFFVPVLRLHEASAWWAVVGALQLRVYRLEGLSRACRTFLARTKVSIYLILFVSISLAVANGAS